MKTWIPFAALAAALFACSTTTPPPTDIPILPTDTVAPAATIAPTSIPSTPDVTEGWPVYENASLGYSFKYPSECFFGPMPANCKQSPPEERAPECLCFLDAENPNEVFIQAFLGDPAEGLMVSFYVMHHDTEAFNPPEGEDWISWINTNWSYLSDEMPDEVNMTFGGLPAVRIYTPGGGGGSSADNIFVVKDGKLILISMINVVLEEQREFYEQILSTFQFID